MTTRSSAGAVISTGSSATERPAAAGRTAIALTTGEYHSCAVLDDATVKCWGDNFHGQLGGVGDGGPTPSTVVGVTVSVPDVDVDVDTDGDGVLDGDDFCADTEIPETLIPTNGTLTRNRYAMTEASEFFTRGEKPGSKRYSIHDTRGCNAEQIADHMGYGTRSYERGLSNSQMKKFIAMVSV